VGYANHEWIAPRAVKDINAFKRSKSRKLHQQKRIQTLSLEDGSELVYQTFDAKTSQFFDVFWICSPKEIWIMQSLSFAQKPPKSPTPPKPPKPPKPIGRGAEHLLRTSSGLLEKVESFDVHLFENMPMSHLGIPGEIIPFEGRTLSTLYRESFNPTTTQSGGLSTSAQTHLHRKLALPLLPLLALIAIAPFAMTFSRHKRAFSLVAISVFGFALFMTLYDSLIILGEHRMISPIAAMWLPILAAFAFAGRRFWKMR
jgi:lipopolysaccharide export LptBFGC system permease protein LptF